MPKASRATFPNPAELRIKGNGNGRKQHTKVVKLPEPKFMEGYSEGQGPGRGRRPGAKNRINMMIKDMIHEAIENEGGTKVFQNFLKKYPVEFMQHLVKPMLPRNLDMNGVLGAPTSFSEFIKMVRQSEDADLND